MSYSPRNAGVERTFFWHDYETTGVHKQLDRPTQFAGIRTNENLEIVDDPVMVYCQPGEDVLFHPMAVALTGITPQICKERGLAETDFAKAVLKELGKPGTCGTGYNTISFDDEISRNMFFRNFEDPYAREWRNNNSRWDLFMAVRMCQALRPEGIVWPTRTDNPDKVSLRLEDLAKANGLVQERAHDALSDVEATIQLARLIKQQQPSLFEYALSLRDKNTVARLIGDKPMIHVAYHYPYERSNTSLVACIAHHPEQKNGRIMVDLTADLSELKSLSPERMADHLFGSKDFDEEERLNLPVTLLQTNKSPCLVSMGAIREDQHKERLGYTGELMEQCKRNFQMVRNDPDLRERIVQAYRISASRFSAPEDADMALYSGFPSRSDQAKRDQASIARPEDLRQLVFENPVYNDLLLRFRARNYPDSLNEEEREQWRTHLRQRLLEGSTPAALNFEDYQKALAEARATLNKPEQKALLDELDLWTQKQIQALGTNARRERRPTP